MFSGRRSARAGAPVGAPFAGSASGRTGVEVFSDKTGKPRLITSGNVADFARGKSEPGLAARSRTVAGGCSGGRAARALVDSAADTAAATDKSCSGSAVPSGDAIEPRIRRHYLTSSKGLLDPPWRARSVVARTASTEERKAAASGRTIRRFEHYRLGSVRTRLSIHYLQIGSELLS